MDLEREEHMIYKITAGQTIYATYEIELEADSFEAAHKKAMSIPPSEWDDERFENGDSLEIDHMKEVKE